MEDNQDQEYISNIRSQWNFDNDVIGIECPDCHEKSLLIDWKMTEVYCDDCGSHDAIMCPKCDEEFDHTREWFFVVIREGETCDSGSKT